MFRRREILRLAAIALAAFALAVAAAAIWFTPTRTGTEAVNQPLVGGPFALTDAEGKRRTDAEFRGRLMLVFFGFVQCPDFCPASLQAVSETMTLLGARAGEIQAVFVTVDPERDTPAVLKNYAANFDRRVAMLTGTPAEIAAVARAYRVYYAKRAPDAAGNYSVDHSVYLYLMGRDGKYITHFRYGITPANLAQAIRRHM